MTDIPKGYKQTEVGVIPEEWVVKTLGEIATIRDGTHQTPKYVPIGIPFYSVEHVTRGDFNNTKFISEDEHRFLTRFYKIEKGDVLMTRIGSIGDCVLVDWDVNASFYVSLALLKINGAIAAYIVAYSELPAFKKEVDGHSLPTATPKKINLGPISNVRVALPPLPEQRAIAAALSDVDALLAGLDRLIAKKRDLKQAAMQQLLTGQTRLPGFKGEWCIIQLCQIGSTYGGLSGKSKMDFGIGSAHYVTFLNVMTNVIIDSSTFDRVRVAPNEAQNQVKCGDILFNGSSETPEEVAMCALMHTDYPNLFLNSFCFGFRLYEEAKVNSLFLVYYIRSPEGREIMKSLAQGSTRYNLSKSALLNASIRLPPLAEQTAIASVLSDMDAEIEALERRRAKTADMKQAMMQELLTGRTRLV